MLTIYVAGKDAMLDVLLDQLDGGSMRVYSGVRPDGPGDAITSGNVLLAEPTFDATAFAPAADGSKTANAITSVNAVATGIATFFRAVASDGVTAIIDGSVGLADTDAIVTSVSVVSGLPYGISRMVIRM